MHISSKQTKQTKNNIEKLPNRKQCHIPLKKSIIILNLNTSKKKTVHIKSAPKYLCIQSGDKHIVRPLINDEWIFSTRSNGACISVSLWYSLRHLVALLLVDIDFRFFMRMAVHCQRRLNREKMKDDWRLLN